MSETITKIIDVGKATYCLAPDLGSLFRNIALAKQLGMSIVFRPKARLANGKVDVHTPISRETIDRLQEVSSAHQVQIIWEGYEEALKGAHIFIRDDELDTGRTAAGNAVWCLQDMGAEAVYFAVTHPICSPGWRELVAAPETTPFTRIWASNAIDRPYRHGTAGLIVTVDVSKVIGSELVQLMGQL